jgi:DNA anti-recombination protein RmuC
MTDLRATVKDAAYVGIGFGVLAFQKAQVQRQELRKRLESGTAGAKGSFEKLGDDVQDRVKLVEERIEALTKQLDAAADDFEDRLEKALDEVQHRLPEQVKEYFAKAREAGKDARAQVRQLAKSAQPKSKATAA